MEHTLRVIQESSWSCGQYYAVVDLAQYVAPKDSRHGHCTELEMRHRAGVRGTFQSWDEAMRHIDEALGLVSV